MVESLQLRIHPYFHQEIFNFSRPFFSLPKKVSNSVLKSGNTATYHKIKKKKIQLYNCYEYSRRV